MNEEFMKEAAHYTDIVVMLIRSSELIGESGPKTLLTPYHKIIRYLFKYLIGLIEIYIKSLLNVSIEIWDERLDKSILHQVEQSTEAGIVRA